MRFVSTKGHSSADDLGSALLAGLAPDGGLFVPEALPHLPLNAYDESETLNDVARVLLRPFFEGDALEGELDAICTGSLDIDAPVVTIAENSTMLELFHGPTAAFKDFGARFLANSLGSVRASNPAASGESPLTILVATSGDTGSAVAAAFHRREGFRVVILYPEGRVSKRQEHQLGCFGDNVTALRVSDTFDVCQAMVKSAFRDDALREAVPLSSANSISLGRLLPQASYYALSALQHFRATDRRLSFIIPTGNLGNAVAALIARQMGLPIDRILFATNHNATIPEFLATHAYRGRPSVSTLANAMDVGDPSNVVRLQHFMRRDPMLAASLQALSVDDDTIRERIRAGEETYGRVFCPHTACAVEMLEDQRRRGVRIDFCVVATAHPSKFEDVVEPLVGHPVAPPATLREMLTRNAMSESLPANGDALKERLLRL